MSRRHEDDQDPSASNSSFDCWKARDAWWKCLDLHDDCEAKCRKQIDELHRRCSSTLIEFFEKNRQNLMKGDPQRKLMLPSRALHTYLTDFRNNANHNFSSHQTGFPFDDESD